MPFSFDGHFSIQSLFTRGSDFGETVARYSHTAMGCPKIARDVMCQPPSCQLEVCTSSYQASAYEGQCPLPIPYFPGCFEASLLLWCDWFSEPWRPKRKTGGWCLLGEPAAPVAWLGAACLALAQTPVPPCTALRVDLHFCKVQTDEYMRAGAHRAAAAS